MEELIEGAGENVNKSKGPQKFFLIIMIIDDQCSWSIWSPLLGLGFSPLTEIRALASARWLVIYLHGFGSGSILQESKIQMEAGLQEHPRSSRDGNGPRSAEDTMSRQEIFDAWIMKIIYWIVHGPKI